MTSLLQHTRRPDITFTRNGRIDITSRVVRLLGIQPGDVINIAIADGELYLFVQHKSSSVIGRHLARCFPTNKGTKGSYRAWSRQLTDTILQMVQRDNSVKLPCGSLCQYNSRTCLPIIFKNPL